MAAVWGIFAIIAILNIFIKADEISSDSRIVVVGDKIASFGKRHKSGFLKQLQHVLGHYHPNVTINSVFINNKHEDITFLATFEQQNMREMLREFRPTHVVAMFGTSDVLAFLADHPAPKNVGGEAGLGSGSLGDSDDHTRRFVSFFADR